MQTKLNYLVLAGAGALLLACAGGGRQAPQAQVQPQPQPQPQPQAADGYYVLGRNQQAARRDADALRSYQQALRLAPGHVNARNGLAVLYAGQGDYGRAIALWQGLTGEGAPGRAFLLNNLGYAYFLSGDMQRALETLEKACVLDPLNALTWENLGQVLEQTGQGERAALMFRQAQSLRSHDPRADYALTRAAPAGSGPAGANWPDSMPRTELSQSGGMFSLRRVAATAPAAAPVAVTTPQTVPQTAPLRLEILNGNGVTGMAATLARALASGRLQVTRLGNERGFQVARTRVEYRPPQGEAARELATRLGPQVATEPAACKAADMRVVLGRDLLDPIALRQYYLRQLELARIELAKLG
ncbi:Flp pilus assembly protein TadD [Oxalobacteraceae bacterium GrIS 1.11]